YFDMDRVLNESKRWAKERDAFVKRGTELQKAFDKKAAELKALKDALEKKAGMLSEQARREQEREYQQKAKELDRLAQDADTELKQMNKESATRFNKSLMIVLKKLGQEAKYILILEAGTVPYASKEIDITDQVIKAFDAAKE
ncbi:MAG: OmpH family outer membrane protein, partial [Desulfobacterales bacterium]|nr:OmpH family outer membrane protein [Desulfobacterales bacterium]